MARYRVCEYLNNKPVSETVRRTRPAAYNLAYAKWYEYLGYNAGRDTQWGWRGVNLLSDWFITGRAYEHGDKLYVTHFDYTLTVIREA